MKSLPFVLGCLCLVVACKNKESDCGKDITLVQPDANPANYEIIIRPDGFSQQAKVLFGQEEATTRAGNNGDIIAKVPAGLRGSVELTLEEGDCLARQNFTVLDSLPGTYGQSLPNIVLPSPPSSYISNISNFWRNAADPDHAFQLSQDGLSLDPLNSFESHASNPALGAFGNTNPISGTIDTLNHKVHLIVDRSPNGGGIEEFDGVLIKDFPGADTLSYSHFILLVSTKTGRQLVLMTT